MSDPAPKALTRTLLGVILLMLMAAVSPTRAQAAGADAPDEAPGVSVSLPSQDGKEDPSPEPSAPSASPYRLEDADDALFEGDHARALEIYLALSEGSGLTAGEAAMGAGKLYATGRGTAKDPALAAKYFGRAFDLTFDAALEVHAMGEVGDSALAKLDATLGALANRFATGDQVPRDFQRAVDMDLRLIDELLSGATIVQLCTHYADATSEEARYVPGREFLVNYMASLALGLMTDEIEEDLREGLFNNLGELYRGGPDRADADLLEAKTQPFPVSYSRAFWAYELAAERYASGTAMYSLGVMHYRAMGLPAYWIDGADSPAVRFRKERRRLEAARDWFRRAIVHGDPEGETWFVGVSNRLLDLAEDAADSPALEGDVQQIRELLLTDPGFTADVVSPPTWAGVEAFRDRAGASSPAER